MSINPYEELEHIKQLISKKSFTDAYKSINVFIKQHGLLKEAVFLKAKISRRLKKFDEALKLFKSLKQTPEYKMESYWGQSMIYSSLGEKEKAETLYMQLINYSENMPIVKESKKALLKIVDEKVTSKNLLLTTFPKHASNNVGDQLISFSTIKLIKSNMIDFDPIFEFLQQQLQNNFNDYNQVYKFIDKTYEDFIRPYFNQLSDKLSKE